MKLNIVIAGDSHYDLKTDGIDRTDDINNAKHQIIDYMADLKEIGEEVVYLDMGDVFHGTRPRSEVIAKVIRTYSRINKWEIPTYIIAGNHDVIDQQGRTSALEPLIAVGFEYINVYHNIELVVIREGLNLVTLPHISKARAIESGFKSVQEFIDYKSTEIEKMLPKNEINIVIGHMNISGAKTGTESYMIKGSHEDFPDVLKKSKKIDYIFNGHIHRMQTINNPGGAPILITGDISCNDFGERLDQKCFYHLEVEV